jgi:aryl-alcohol dehydrogenase-like predicted oxidoreductase
VDARPRSRDLPALRELGIDFVPYSDLGRGFLSGAGKSAHDLFDTGSERLEAASTAPARDDREQYGARRSARLLT